MAAPVDRSVSLVRSQTVFRSTFPGVNQTTVAQVAPKPPKNMPSPMTGNPQQNAIAAGKPIQNPQLAHPGTIGGLLDPLGYLVAGEPFSKTNAAKLAKGQITPKQFVESPFQQHGQVNAQMPPIPLGAGGAAASGIRAVRDAGRLDTRTIGVNDLEAQLPRARSRITQRAIEQPADKISQALQKSERAKKTRVVRLATAQERAIKAAGRAQRVEQPRAGAKVAQHINAIKGIKEGSPEDVANHWYAQLPKPFRNAKGLQAVRDWQATHLADLTSGEYAARLDRQERAIRAKLFARHLGGETEDVPSGVIEPGVIVHAADQNNYGQVTGVNRDVATVHFINRQDGTEATVNLPVSLLTSSGLRVKPGAAADVAAEVNGRDVFPLLKELEQIKLLRTDLPQHELDTAASVSQLDKLIAKPPKENEAAIRAAHVLGNERAQILIDAGRLKAEKVEPRKYLLSNALGLTDTAAEDFAPFIGENGPAYVGHRLAKPEPTGSFVGPGGVGRVKSPEGAGSENKLVIARNGRARQSLRVALQDWQAAQTFRHAIQARNDLGAAGDQFQGFVPEGHMLVNPQAKVIPPQWKTDELAQFHGDYEDIQKIRDQAQKIVDQFVGADPEAHQRMIDEALMNGQDLSTLRVVPERLVKRYYGQFKASSARGSYAKVYDSLVDAVATSIVFARIGYIPKNFVQNLVMAIPHQGAYLLPNAVKAAQVMADPELRHLFQAEIGFTGATGAISREAAFKKVTGAIAGFVSKGADDPIRMAALMHELGAEHIINPHKPFLSAADRQKLIQFFTDPRNRQRLNDVRSRTVESMADFSRLTPDQSRRLRRIVIIPGWLMAGSRYPFHFAATHPIRSALMAYIALGEPGSPDHFNKRIDRYFTGSSYKQGIQIGNRRFRTNSLSPVQTPWDLGASIVGSIQGKKGPFDYSTPTAFDYVQPGLGALVNIAQGEGVKKSLTRLIPDYTFVRGMIHPKASSSYPQDATRIGRLEREIGVIPIQVNDGTSGGASAPRRRSGSLVGASTGSASLVRRSGPRANSLVGR